MNSYSILFGSLLITAVGAILRYGVSASADGVDLQNIGLIVMIVGIIGVVIGIIAAFSSRKSTTVVSDGVGVSERVDTHRGGGPLV